MASVIDGSGNALLWVAQGKYISDCACEEKKGFFFSLFYTIYMFSSLIGSLMAVFLLGAFPMIYFFIVMTLLALASTIIFALLRKPEI